MHFFIYVYLCIFKYILMDIQACIIVVSFGNDIIHDFNRSCAQVGQRDRYKVVDKISYLN